MRILYNEKNRKGSDRVYQVRKARWEDFDRILEIYAIAREFMVKTGNPTQWGTNYPPAAMLEGDIPAGNLYVVEDDAIHGVFAYFTEPDPTYAYIEQGAWLDESPYGVVHRIASDGSVKGTGSFCISWAYDQCGHLRIDTHGDNTVMQNLLKKLGFVRCGTIYVVEDNDPRIAYEKSSTVHL